MTADAWTFFELAPLVLRAFPEKFRGLNEPVPGSERSEDTKRTEMEILPYSTKESAGTNFHSKVPTSSGDHDSSIIFTTAVQNSENKVHSILTWNATKYFTCLYALSKSNARIFTKMEYEQYE